MRRPQPQTISTYIACWCTVYTKTAVRQTKSWEECLEQSYKLPLDLKPQPWHLVFFCDQVHLQHLSAYSGQVSVPPRRSQGFTMNLLGIFSQLMIITLALVKKCPMGSSNSPVFSFRVIVSPNRASTLDCCRQMFSSTSHSVSSVGITPVSSTSYLLRDIFLWF